MDSVGRKGNNWQAACMPWLHFPRAEIGKISAWSCKFAGPEQGTSEVALCSCHFHELRSLLTPKKFSVLMRGSGCIMGYWLAETSPASLYIRQLSNNLCSNLLNITIWMSYLTD
jgi:hypothetical protein